MNIHTIKNYIIKHYPKSTIALLSNQHTNEELLKECEAFFYYERLNWCDCGNPNLAKQTIKDYLQCLRDNKRNSFEKQFGVKSIYDNGLLLCLAYTLDAIGLTEHGSGIGSAWLTEEGEMFLWLLNRNEKLKEVNNV